MIAYDIEHDYVETALAIDERPHNLPAGGIMLRSDHEHEPTFAVFSLNQWKAVRDTTFAGIVKEGMCSKCHKRVLLRVPQHLVVALRLLGHVC